MSIIDHDIIEFIGKGLIQLKITPTPIILERFYVYLKELEYWNQRMNLTGFNDYKEIIIKNFFDSISCKEGTDFSREDLKVVDIGSGAGFPGLPLKLCYPKFNIVIIESSKKKVEFLTHLSELLKLNNTKFLAKRAEEVAKEEEHREKYDIALSRALAPMRILSELCLPFLEVGGKLIAQKSTEVHKDIAEAENAIKITGGKLVEIKDVTVPFLDAKRVLIIIEKVANTPLSYPRNPGIPQKRPIRNVSHET